MMLEDLVACGGAVEVTGRGSHRLYSLPGTEGIRGETAAAAPAGRPSTGARAERPAPSAPSQP